MKNKLTSFFVILSCLLSSLLVGAQTDLFQKTVQEPKRIIINNRILAKVEGKPISTYDVAKKMDLLFYRQYPEYISSIPARYEFYQYSWKSVMEELIHKELILADAKEHKIEVSSGDIRQEMETSFGPNIIENLDKVGMSFDDAANIMEGDILIGRMLSYRANARALKAVTPLKVRQAYEEYIKDPNNIRHNQWRYQVITVKDRNPKKTEDTANKAYQLLIEEKTPLNQLVTTMREKKFLGRKAKVTISAEIVNNEKEVSESYKQILSGMEPGIFSQPSMQKSRANNTTVYRIFYVIEKIPGGAPTFNEMENKLRDQLLEQVSNQETVAYLSRLRHHYRQRDQDLQDTIPADYQPFTLL